MQTYIKKCTEILYISSYLILFVKIRSLFGQNLEAKDVIGVNILTFRGSAPSVLDIYIKPCQRYGQPTLDHCSHFSKYLFYCFSVFSVLSQATQPSSLPHCYTPVCHTAILHPTTLQFHNPHCYTPACHTAIPQSTLHTATLTRWNNPKLQNFYNPHSIRLPSKNPHCLTPVASG